ncbi:MAG TPA: GNAT family N-acetyltransferase, partial [Desulfocapsa sulfexigens]|nr:GNAT family N-acetyltransferase [Desulfocapsa sulfexigens]
EVEDIPLLASHHRMMFEEMRAVEGDNGPKDSCCSGPDCFVSFPSPMESSTPAPDFKQLEAVQRSKLEQQLTDGSCVAWICEWKGEPVGSGAVSIIKTVPVPEDLSFEVGFLHSVYTIKSMRGRGVASTILDHLLDHCLKKGLHRVQLSASEAGREIYRNKGFRRMDEAMIFWL